MLPGGERRGWFGRSGSSGGGQGSEGMLPGGEKRGWFGRSGSSGGGQGSEGVWEEQHPTGVQLGAGCCVCAWVRVHTCAWECVCVHSWGMGEDKSSAQPFEIDSAGSSPIYQVQTEPKPHFNSLLSNLSIFLINVFNGSESLPFLIKRDHWTWHLMENRDQVCKRWWARWAHVLTERILWWGWPGLASASGTLLVPGCIYL